MLAESLERCAVEDAPETTYKGSTWTWAGDQLVYSCYDLLGDPGSIPYGFC